MKIFNQIIDDIATYKHQKQKSALYREFPAKTAMAWPEAGKRDIILMPDLAMELGSPGTASVSFMVWTGDGSRINDQRITLIGPDLTETSEKHIPFGKIVMAEVEGFDENNAFARNREIYLKKFDLSLKGYMLRSASHYMAEWNRISKTAVKNGFSFYHLGSALINEYKKIDYVKSVEVIFVTSSVDDVNELYDLGKRSTRMISAMSKMVNEMSYDCSACEYQDLCGEALELRKLRTKLVEKIGS
jgi:CO dehydrogenase/acetyl-CoA synthase beta subunit